MLELNDKYDHSSFAFCIDVLSLEQLVLPVSRGVFGAVCQRGQNSLPWEVNYYETRSPWSQTSGEARRGIAWYRSNMEQELKPWRPLSGTRSTAGGLVSAQPTQEIAVAEGEERDTEVQICVFIPHSRGATFSYHVVWGTSGNSCVSWSTFLRTLIGPLLFQPSLPAADKEDGENKIIMWQNVVNHLHIDKMEENQLWSQSLFIVIGFFCCCF